MASDDKPPNEDIGPTLIAVSTVLIFFVFLTGSLRLFVRARRRTLGWDDATILLSIAIGAARWAIEVVQGVNHDNGKHREYVSKENYDTNNRLGWYAQIFLFAAICFLKLSIMLLILRMKDSRPLRWILGVAMAGLVITNGGVIVILLAECRPIGYYQPVATCWDPKVRIYSIYFTIAYSIVTDFLCSCLPLVVVWKVRIPMRTKVMVVGLMSMGLLATGFGIARAASLNSDQSDLTWAYAVAALWSNIELYLGQTAANLALSRQIYQYFFPTDNPSHAGSYFPKYASNHSRTNYRFSRKLRDPANNLNLAGQDTFIESSGVRPSLSKSEGSEIPLEPGIRKKTEFWISEGTGPSTRPGTGSVSPYERPGTGTVSPVERPSTSHEYRGVAR